MSGNSSPKPQLTLDTLLLLRQCLHAQQLNVGDPAFVDTAQKVVAAHAELEAAIADGLSEAG